MGVNMFNKGNSDIFVLGTSLLIFGAVAIPYTPLIGVSTLVAGVGSTVYKVFKEKEKESSSNVNIIEKIFFENGVRVMDGWGKFLIPEVVDVRTEKDIKIIGLKVPVGMSVRELGRCSFAFQDFFKCRDIAFEPKGGTDYDMLLYYDKPKGVKLNAWDILWRENGIYSGGASDMQFPIYIGNKKIKGGVKYVFKLPIGKSSFHVSKMDITIKEFLSARSINITPTKDNVIEIDAVYEELNKDVQFKLIDIVDKNKLEVVIGESIYGYVRLNLTSLVNILVAGATGSGKSVCVKTIIMGLLLNYSSNELIVYLSDLKKTELSRFSKVKNVKCYVDDIEGTKSMIDELYSICEERLNLFRDLDVSDIVEYNNVVSKDKKLPFIFVVIEEFVRYTSGDGRDVKARKDKLSELLFICRASGISICLTVQRPTKNNLGEDIKSSLGNIIGLRTVNSQNSKVICEDANLLGKLRGDGHGYLFNDNGQVEFQGFYLSNKDISNLLKDKGLYR